MIIEVFMDDEPRSIIITDKRKLSDKAVKEFVNEVTEADYYIIKTPTGDHIVIREEKIRLMKFTEVSK